MSRPACATTSRWSTRYLLAAVQLAGYLVAEDPDSAGARGPGLVTRRQVVAFQAWMVESRSAGTALNKYKGVIALLWLACGGGRGRVLSDGRGADAEVGQKLVPIMTGDETRRLLAECQGNEFAQVRDQALIRMYCSTGARVSEMGGLLVTDVDLDTESVCCRTVRVRRIDGFGSGRIRLAR